MGGNLKEGGPEVSRAQAVETPHHEGSRDPNVNKSQRKDQLQWLLLRASRHVMGAENAAVDLGLEGLAWDLTMLQLELQRLCRDLEIGRSRLNRPPRGYAYLLTSPRDDSRPST